MSIVITNISKTGAKRCRYQLKINTMLITEFTHLRSDGLAVCLRKAADAAEKHEAEKFLRWGGTQIHEAAD